MGLTYVRGECSVVEPEQRLVKHTHSPSGMSLSQLSDDLLTTLKVSVQKPT